MKTPVLRHNRLHNYWVDDKDKPWLCGHFVDKYFPEVDKTKGVVLSVKRKHSYGATQVELAVEVSRDGYGEIIDRDVTWEAEDMNELGETYWSMNNALLAEFYGEFPLSVWVTVEETK